MAERRLLQASTKLAPSNLTLDDPEGSKFSVKICDSKYLKNGDRCEVGSPDYVGTMGFLLAPSDLTLDDLKGSKIKVILVDVKFVKKSTNYNVGPHGLHFG